MICIKKELFLVNRQPNVYHHLVYLARLVSADS